MIVPPAPRSKTPYRSRESVRQIEERALRALRHNLNSRGIRIEDLL